MVASRAQLVATLGPSSREAPELLIEAGATALRINTSHTSAGELSDMMRMLCERLPQVPLVLDLQGAKMRLGRFNERQVQCGERLVFALGVGRRPVIDPLPHPRSMARASGRDAEHGRRPPSFSCR